MLTCENGLHAASAYSLCSALNSSRTLSSRSSTSRTMTTIRTPVLVT